MNVTDVGFNAWAGLVAGLCGGIIMAMWSMGMRPLNREPQLEVSYLWGTMLGLDGMPGRVAGMAIHLLLSIGLGVTYAAIFGWLGAIHALWIWGMFIGFVHWMLAGVFLGYVDWIHPDMPERIERPGAFALLYGFDDAGIFFAGHLLFGFVVGFVYAYLVGGGNFAAWALGY